MTHDEFFSRYLHAGPIGRDANAVAALFAEDGVFEAPLVPAGHHLPRLLEGRAAIRAGIRQYHQDLDVPGAVNIQESRYCLHTVDPSTFVVEIDTVFDLPDGSRSTMSFVQIFRLRDGKIARLRDYFSVDGAGGSVD
ncbi:nuclear transport factor 2 family protein [Kutzneria sp. NPDC052558]|uniref:nuclear transport factor 2 family protein n=1 Tax=Kutzneria sp. NPDC052558 TaxID=3364121 RepID=UPI0037CC6F9B